MTPQQMAVALLQEVNPPVAAALDALGGELPAIGLLGFLPDEDRLAACKAVCLAYDRIDTPEWDYGPAELSELIQQEYLDDSWALYRTFSESARATYLEARG